MNQWNLIIDVARCENCNNCVLANKDEYVGNDFPGYSAPHALHGPATIRILRQVRGERHMVDAAYLPVMCNHCDDAPCMKNAGDAIRKRPDGIVIIDPIKSKGRRDLVDACPYGAIVWNEEQSIPQQWIFDAHLLDAGWKEPRCAQSCPTGAIRALKADSAEMARIAESEDLRVLQPEFNSRPRVYYRNLHRFTQCFIGGSVVAQRGGVLDCVEGAWVTLSQHGAVIATSQTDAFGDFKFDGLPPDSGHYRLTVAHNTLGSAEVDATLGTNVVLGEIKLRPSGTSL
ncbi:4Fe-4S dicluster domain-containing protein [Burkholderia multivorans]|uniref:4Fe-4S dicluster domain-containing protein n=1 Tax=Burkholderia multivorans TaxID=87883 RepID=UPI0002781AF8|nr:4Fe-4S dicluster domain-containing protein [Burkholderia multivorans]EJO59646.1 putative pyrogallol hydroxytransferase small subunit [Burkholderia multivorans CF2]MBJ9658859.1 carboxypeptidase regulatory-like domain-containing protein [Burkholderia multivorans]MBR8048801.1 carboxypeptidase regulatory-like domain-containing protein [Burkholderia multivorans]MBR8122405.1 carboxypeptidase regulatory-like domain-containing protein [Burkholderia multivorans]MBU9471706.1 carboxypeptidase regulato